MSAAEMGTIGLDIGGTHLRGARVGADGTIEARAKDASGPDPQAVLDRCLSLIARLRTPGATGIGIGVPGQVDAASRRVLSGGFVDLSGLDLAARVEAAAGLPVTLENDAAMALLGEARAGAARGHASAAMLTIGTGIGGAVLEGGRLLRGGGVAGQLGHMIVPGGGPCVCGRTGCVETASSGTAFAAHLARAGLPAGTRAEELTADDPHGVLRAWAAPLRAAIDTLVAVCNPGLVVIGGGAGAAMARALALVPPARSWFDAPVVPAALGDDAGVTGAALAARPAGKRLVIVNGVPASGKSAVARALADRTGWPLYALDTVKGPFLAALAPVDRPFNRLLGRAAYDAIFDLLADAPAGATAILDAWFGFQPVDVLRDGLRRAGIADLAEVWCHAPPEVVGARYAARAADRPAGHPGADYVPELVALARTARPTGLAEPFRLDTTGPPDLGALTAWLRTALPH